MHCKTADGITSETKKDYESVVCVQKRKKEKQKKNDRIVVNVFFLFSFHSRHPSVDCDGQQERGALEIQWLNGENVLAMCHHIMCTPL